MAQASIDIEVKWPAWWPAWNQLVDEMYPDVCLLWPKSITAKWRIAGGEWHDFEVELKMIPNDGDADA